MIIAAAALTETAAAACGPSQALKPTPPPPVGLTEEVRSYARCLDAASAHGFDQNSLGQRYNKGNSKEYAFARCRLLEPPPVHRHLPGSPGNDQCSDEYFAWYGSYNQTTRNLISRVFAETVCASPEAAPEKRTGESQR